MIFLNFTRSCLLVNVSAANSPPYVRIPSHIRHLTIVLEDVMTSIGSSNFNGEAVGLVPLSAPNSYFAM